jgi:phosphoribosylamine---glycine ligase
MPYGMTADCTSQGRLEECVGRRVLVIGGGGREHALAWKLAQSPSISAVYCAPGNPGTASIATNLPLAANSIPGIIAAADQHAIDFVMIGPEEPLAQGLADALRASGISVCGHSAAAARIESSKAFAKAIMDGAGIPTARSITATTRSAAIDALALFGAPVVIKADGLAAGKGVVIAQSRQEAEDTVSAFMVERAFGDAGSTIVIEEFLTGLEVSAFALVQGKTVVPLMASCDHKPVFDGNRGPNTGGMGAYAPPPQIDPALLDQVTATILKPVSQAMAAHGAPLQGILYAGLILTPSGPKVIEFNARFGDPETQVILPLMESDLGDALYAVAAGTLAQLPPVTWKSGSAVCVVLASGGYPGSYTTGFPIEGLERVPGDVEVFHAGTKLGDDGRIVTGGGRVLNVVGFGGDLEAARIRAYAGVDAISFPGMQYRTDIGSFGFEH